MKKTNVLWVDKYACDLHVDLMTPVFVNGNYALDYVDNIESAIRLIQLKSNDKNDYQIIITEVSNYKQFFEFGGIKLLKDMFSQDPTKEKKRVGIITYQPKDSLIEQLAASSIDVNPDYVVQKMDSSPMYLVDLINKIASENSR